MSRTKSTPRSKQRTDILELFNTKTHITRFDVMEALGLTEQVATKQLTAMWKDGQLNREREANGKGGAPGYVYTRIVLRYNTRLTMALRRRAERSPAGFPLISMEAVV